MNETSAFHPIACESCRNKKSKCDRELPVCSQCSSSGVSCRYPQINKRGIPSGYISLIEQRLLQTEIVVLELLSAIYKSQTSIDLQPLPETGRRLLANYAQKQAKSHKIEEWQSLPLNTENQRHIWWSKKSDLIAKTAEAHGSRSTQESPAATSPWGMDSPEILLHESMQPPCAGSSTLSPLGHSDVAQAGWRPIAGGTSIPEPTAGLDHLDQSMPGNPTVDYIAGEGIHGDMEATPAPPSQTMTGSRPIAEEKWRKYF